MTRYNKVRIKLENCKNIQGGEISIFKNTLNIKYALNGTGKSTIGEAIKYSVENNLSDLNELRSFGAESDPTIQFYIQDENGSEISDPHQFNRVEIFNEDFVKDVVFQENEAIKSSFDVFIKSEKFEEKRRSIDNRLNGLRIDIAEDAIIKEMRQIFEKIVSNIRFKSDGKIDKRGMGKDIINQNTVYNLPDQLQKYQDFFFSNNKVDWVNWKLTGFNYDDKSKCPFCAVPLEDETYLSEKEVFQTNYNAKMIKNKTELENYLEFLKPFINETDYDRLYKFTREIINEKDFEDEFIRFTREVEHVNRKISESITFSSFGIENRDLGDLKTKIIQLKISIDSLKYFNSEKANDVLNRINEKIDALIIDVSQLQGEIAALNGVIDKAIQDSKSDINEFLRCAGINYEFNIIPLGENSSKAEMRYIDKNQTYEVQNHLRKHLSWGEKNSIALILFMYSALHRNADLIILDDPISSFDKNKKFAIMNRLFQCQSENSFWGKTVLFLTHDFEPIIDLMVQKRFIGKFANAYQLINRDNIVTEKVINPIIDIKPITVMYSDNAQDMRLNIINRIAALRKYIEYTNKDYRTNVAYNLISSLMKGRQNPTIFDHDNNERSFTQDEYQNGLKEIILKISDFDYDNLLMSQYNKKEIIEQYQRETNSYFKLQTFRQLHAIESLNLTIDDEVLKKYADETFHIENDYSHYLNYNEFDIVPPFILEKMDVHMASLQQSLIQS